MNVVMKSGTRDFHGSPFRVRPQRPASMPAALRLSARPRCASTTSAGPWAAPLHSRQMERLSRQVVLLRRPGVEVTTSGRCPDQHGATAEERAGDFRNSFPRRSHRPAERGGIRSRTVPSTRFSANGAALLKPYPLPNFNGPARQLLHQRRQPHRHARRPAESRLPAVRQHPTHLPMDSR
jgi:hypothetical protein